MSKRAMFIDAFLPSWAWKAKLRAADPADRWKIRLLRIGAGMVVAVLLLLLDVHNRQLW